VRSSHSQKKERILQSKSQPMLRKGSQDSIYSIDDYNESTLLDSFQDSTENILDRMTSGPFQSRPDTRTKDSDDNTLAIHSYVKPPSGKYGGINHMTDGKTDKMNSSPSNSSVSLRKPTPGGKLRSALVSRENTGNRSPALGGGSLSEKSVSFTADIIENELRKEQSRRSTPKVTSQDLLLRASPRSRSSSSHGSRSSPSNSAGALYGYKSSPSEANRHGGVRRTQIDAEDSDDDNGEGDSDDDDEGIGWSPFVIPS
jgi:hypothetical protein